MENFTPKIDEPLKKWLIQTAFENRWRVVRWMDIDELIGDGYMIAAIIMNKYKLVNQRHFMSMVMVAYHNHLTSLARRKQRRGDDVRIVHATPAGSNEEWWLDTILGHIQNDGMLERLMSQAKFPVDAVISLFTTEKGIVELRRHPQRSHEPLNRYLCRLIGLNNKEYDVPALVHSFMSGSGIYFLHQPLKSA